MPATSRVIKASKTETDVAVLQVQVANIRDDVSDLRDGIDSVRESINENTRETHKLLKEMADAAERAHEELNRKITTLERWRWTMIGAGTILAGIGFDTLSKLFL